MAVKLLFLMLFLSLSFLLSAFEVAFFSGRQDDDLASAIVKYFRRNEKWVLSTILIFNAVWVFLFAFLAASVAVALGDQARITPVLSVSVETVLVSGILVIFADAVPKIVASKNIKTFVTLGAPVILFFMFVGLPLTLPLGSLLNKLAKSRKGAKVIIDREGLRTLSQMAGSSGLLGESEAELLKKISLFGEKIVRDIMTPRTAIVSIEKGSPLQQVIQVFQQSHFTHLVVYEKSLDEVAGLLHIRDILRLSRDRRRKKIPYDLIMRRPIFVPETQPVEKLLDTFRTYQTRNAIVVDEFGGVAGLVTVSDVVKSVFGESAEQSRDEWLRRVAIDGSYIVPGVERLDNISAQIGEFDFEYDPGKTISSLLTETIGAVPRIGARLQLGSYLFEVVQATPKQILHVRIKRLNLNENRNGEQEKKFNILNRFHGQR
ncbi:MAG: hemolysin family protein [Candidatus Kryptoniota bacterium]